MATTVDPKDAYEAARIELQNALLKKRQVDKTLAVLEQNLLAFETNYLTETAASGGNIITGFEAYLKPAAANKKRHEITEADRIFSNSSYTILRSLEVNAGPSTPPPLDYPSLPQTVALHPQGESSLSQRRPKRVRREDTRGISDGEESVTASTRQRPGKRVRLES